MADGSSSLQTRMRAALTSALKQRDAAAVAALRSALGAIDNATAVNLAHEPTTSGSRIAGAVEGVGAGDAARRDLTDEEIEAIVLAEITERESAAVEYERLGRYDRSAALQAEAVLLRSFSVSPRAEQQVEEASGLDGAGDQVR